LLRGLAIRMRWRSFIVAYAVGEMTLPLPSGIYVQNFVIRKLHGSGFARSAGATTIMLLLELVIVMAVLVIIPVPRWSWLRPAAGTVLAGCIGLAVVLPHSEKTIRRLAQRFGRGRLRWPAEGVVDLVASMRTLVSEPFRLLWALALSTAYLLLLVGAFLWIGHGVRLWALTYQEALTIYSFSLGVTYLGAGVIGQIGPVELAGTGLAHVWGYDTSDGLAMLLGFRLAWIVSIWLWGAPVLWFLRRELHHS